MVETPDRSHAQRLDALLLANDVRSKRAELKVEIKRGTRSALDVLEHPPPETGTMKVFDLLLATPKIGRVKVNKMMSRVQVSPSKTVGGLSQRQRSELCVLLGRDMRARQVPQPDSEPGRVTSVHTALT